MASTSAPSAEQAIAWLAEQRRRPDRQSAQAVSYGELILEGGHLKRLGDDVWPFLEQIALGALDMGKLDLAELCVSRLHTRFPDSPRVASLQGMLLEARGELGQALSLYDAVLAKDESSLIVVKRMVAVLKSMGDADSKTGPAKAIAALTKYLDTYYTDPEGWQELAAIYLEQHMYSQAAYALEELLLLAPQNTFFVLQYAETLATQGELSLSYKAYLRVLEMCERNTAAAAEVDGDKASTQQGPFARALWGLKLVTSKLRAGAPSTATGGATQQRKGGNKGQAAAAAAAAASAASGEQQAPSPEKLEAVDAMVTDLLLNKAYKGPAPGMKATREAARKVLAA